jgi:aminopeptidase
MRDPRIDKLAQVLVNYSVSVKRGDVVRIVGSATAMPLIRAIYREVVIAGGHPVLRILDDECTDIFFEHAGPEQLAYLSPLLMNEVRTADCSIGIWAGDNTKSMTRVDPRKQAAVSKARRPFSELFMKRAARKGKGKLRWSGTQFPCHSSAQDAELSLAQYEDFVYGAGLLSFKDPAAEWRKISVRQKRVCDVLNKTHEMRFRTPQGTDIRFCVKGRRWINCDGHENFPDGEVFTGPIEDATEGEVCFSFPAVYRGQEVHDVRLRFKAGKVVDASASKGEAFLLQMIDQDKGGRFVGELALGTNYSIKDFTRNTLFDEKIGGTFHMALGAGYPETGSRNKSGLHWDMVCDLRQGGVVEADGKVISRNGRFVRADWPGPARR